MLEALHPSIGVTPVLLQFNCHHSCSELLLLFNTPLSQGVDQGLRLCKGSLLMGVHLEY